MARPQKSGIEYFSLDIKFDDKIELLEAKYGMEGFGILIKLWQKIYSNSYYINWNDDSVLLFKKVVNADINLISAIINDCLRWEIFDKSKYEKYSILTSKGIQKRYVEATQRRKEVEFTEEYLLIENVTEKYQKTVNVSINSINTDINSKKDNIGTQSKVKESKEDIYVQFCENCTAAEEAVLASFKTEEIITKLCKAYRSGRNNKTESRKHFVAILSCKKKFGGSDKVIGFNHLQLYYAIKEYTRHCEEKELEADKILLLSTFLNGRVADYVEATKENYEKYMGAKYGENWREVKFSYE